MAESGRIEDSTGTDAEVFKNPGNAEESKKPTSEGGWKIIAQSRHDEEYSMRSDPRGRAIIFNHYEYDDLNISKRKGTDKDRDRIDNVLKDLKFKTEIHNNKTFSEIQKVLQQVSTADHSKYDCLIIVIMSHGEMFEIKNKDENIGKLIDFLEKNKQFQELFSGNKAGMTRKEVLDIKDKEEKVGKVTQIWARDQLYNEEELWKPFLEFNESLIGKPKLIFIQACRIVEGKDDLNTGTLMPARHQREEANATVIEEKLDFYSIPHAADLLIARSTFEECYAYRQPDKGSWFIQTLCDELEMDIARKDVEKQDLLRLLTSVNRKVAFNKPENTTDENKAKANRIAECKQTPNFYSTLLRLLYFKNV